MSAPFKNSKLNKREQHTLDIINAAIELYANSGMDGLSIREIARKTEMSPKNVYNYILSKREIFIAMRVKFLKSIENLISEIISKNKNSLKNIILKIAQKFMEWASENKEGFNILFLSEPPKSSQRGPIEEAYEPGKPLEIIQELIQTAYENGTIFGIDPDSFTAYIWQYVYGAAYIERSILVTKNSESKIPNYKHKKNPVFMKLDPLEYRNFILQNFQNQLENFFKGEIKQKEIETKIAFVDKWIDYHHDNIKLQDYWLWIKEFNDIERIVNFYEIIQNNIKSLENKLEDIIKSVID